MRTTRFTGALLAVALPLATPVFAATPGDKADPAAQHDDAPETQILRGLDLRRAGKDIEALPYFQRAFDKAPTPRATAQLGLVEQALGRWPDAEGHLGRALEAKSDPWIKKNRAVLTQSLETVRSHIAQIDLAGTPVGASVLLNGRVAGTLPLAAPLRVGAGYVELELRAPGHATAKRVLTLTNLQVQSLFVVLEKAAPVASDVGLRDSRSGATGGATPRSRRNLRITGLALGAAGLVGVGVGAWQSLRVRSLQRNVEQETNPDREAKLRASGRTAETLQWAAYGIGAGVLVAGGIVYYLGHRGATVTPIAGSGMAGFAVAGTF